MPAAAGGSPAPLTIGVVVPGSYRVNGEAIDDDPWTFVMVNSARDVLPCCWHGPVATLEGGAALDPVVEGDAVQRLRARLLSGELDDHYRSCRRAAGPIRRRWPPS